MKPFFTLALLAFIGLVVFMVWQNSRNTEGIDRRLLEAVKGNKALAKRLLAQARVKYPDKSDRWYVEKVIYDLERDRAGGRGSPSSFRVDRRELRENLFLIGSALWVINSLSHFVERLFRGR